MTARQHGSFFLTRLYGIKPHILCMRTLDGMFSPYMCVGQGERACGATPKLAYDNWLRMPLVTRIK